MPVYVCTCVAYRASLPHIKIVEGLSRCKKCTFEGRNAMAQDLIELISGLKSLAPKAAADKGGIDMTLSFRIVDNYIKAFFTPYDGLLHWAQVHPEYNNQQILRLVALMAASQGWKRKEAKDLQTSIEEFFAEAKM